MNKMIKVVGRFEDTKWFFPYEFFNDRKNGYLYAIKLNNNILKIGHSASPRTRLQTHSTQVKNKLNAIFDEIIIAGLYENRFASEYIFKKSVTQELKSISVSNEWFEFNGFIDDIVKFFPNQ